MNYGLLVVGCLVIACMLVNICLCVCIVCGLLSAVVRRSLSEVFSVVVCRCLLLFVTVCFSVVIVGGVALL